MAEEWVQDSQRQWGGDSGAQAVAVAQREVLSVRLQFQTDECWRLVRCWDADCE